MLNLAAATSHTHSTYALTTHTHSGYASSTHNHDTVYSKLSHTHSASDISGLSSGGLTGAESQYKFKSGSGTATFTFTNAIKIAILLVQVPGANGANNGMAFAAVGQSSRTANVQGSSVGTASTATLTLDSTNKSLSFTYSGSCNMYAIGLY